jgi:O-antigen/teichoic acid export membrane protein
MSRFTELAKSSSAILFSHLSMTVASIFFLAYFARVFTKEEMALFAFLAMLGAWTQFLGGMGLNTLAIRNVAGMVVSQAPEEVSRFISSVIAYRASGIILVSGACAVASPLIGVLSFGHHDLDGLLLIVVGASLLSALHYSLLEVLESLQRFYARSMLDLIVFLVSRGLGIAGFFIAGARGFFLGYLLALLAGVGCSLFLLRSHLTTRLLSLSRLLGRSKGYWALDVLQAGRSQLDQPIIAFLLGAETLAGYFVAKRLFEKAGVLVNAVVMPLGMKFGEVKVQGEEAVRRYLENTLVMAAYLFVPLGFFIAATARPLLILYAGQRYAPFAPVAVAFGFTTIASAMWSVLREAVLRLYTARRLVVLYVGTVVFTLLSYVAFIPLLGVVGVPLAMMTGSAGGAALAGRSLLEWLKPRLPARELCFAAGCGACFLLFEASASLVAGLPVQLASVTVLSGALYMAWIGLAGPAEVRDLLRRLWARVRFVSASS